ncbi:MAG: hypothetical protein ABIK09_21110 [Pseudomonadota bacterium]
MRWMTLAITMVIIVVAAPATASDARPGPSEVNLFIISSPGVGDEEFPTLRYTDDDALAYMELLGFRATRTHVHAILDNETRETWPGLAKQVLAPQRSDILRGFNEMVEEIQGSDAPQEMFLILVGHGGVDAMGDGYFVLPDGRLTRDDLLKMLERLQGVTVHLIVDTCNAWDLVRPRGEGKWRPDTVPVPVTEALAEALQQEGAARRFPNTGFLLASSEGVRAFEFSLLGSGVFSYLVRSALAGGADLDRDARITYGEVVAFVSAAVSGVESPHSRPDHFIEGPSGDDERVLLDLSVGSDATWLEVDVPGRIWIKDDRAVRVADAHPASDAPVRLRLPGGRSYHVVRQGADALVPSGETARVSTLEFVDNRIAERSAEGEQLRRGLFLVPMSQGYQLGYLEGRQRPAAAVLARSATVRNWSLAAGYRVGSVPLGLDGVSHGARLGLARTLGRWAWMGLSFAYSRSSHRVDLERFHLDGYFVGALAGVRWPRGFGRYLEPFAELELGHQWLVRQAGASVKGDPLSWRGALRAGLSVLLPWGGLSLEFSGGASAQVITLDGSEDVEAGGFGDAAILWRF